MLVKLGNKFFCFRIRDRCRVKFIVIIMGNINVYNFFGDWMVIGLVLLLKIK